MLIPIVAALVVIVALGASAVYVLTNGNNSGGSQYSMTLEEGQSLTNDQLNELKAKAQEHSDVTLTCKSSVCTIVFDSAAICSMESTASFEATTVAASTLDPAAKAILVNDTTALDLSFGSNTNFGSGHATITVPYTLAENQTSDSVTVCYVNGSNVEYVGGTYADGNVTFTTNHLSTYAITYAQKMSNSGLKALGNADGNTVITAADATEIQRIIDTKTPYQLCPIADANNDGVINNDDVTAIQAVITAIADSTGNTKATIWHYNYHDADGDGVMDEELVSTKVPCVSTIITGSANTFMLFYMLDIIDEVKGASYGSGNDTYLYGDNYLNTTKTVKLNSSSTTIPFEDGKAGSSNVISEKNVTVALSDWNRTYLTNEADFESANVDVIRVAAASFDPQIYTHSISLLGLVFMKEDRAADLLASYNNTYKAIKDQVSTLTADKVKKAVASSMNGYLSSEDSDYTKFCQYAGAEFGLKGFDFGGSASITVADNLGVFDVRKYQFDNIVHIRTALTYASSAAQVSEYWSTYANAMDRWEHAYDGQVLVSGAIPVPARVAYIASAIYGDSLGFTASWADSIHSEFAGYYARTLAEAPNSTMMLTSRNYTVTISDDVIVTDPNGAEVTSGSSFKYGTKLHIAAKTEKEGFILRADGSSVDGNNDFIVCADINARYVDPQVLEFLNNYAKTFVSEYSGAYGTPSCAPDNEGLVTMTYVNYQGVNATKDFTIANYPSASEAQAKFNDLKTTLVAKSYNEITKTYSSDFFDGIYVCFTNKLSDGKYAYSTLYLCAYKGAYVVDMCNSYTSCYFLAGTTEGAAFMAKPADERLAFFKAEATTFADALAYAFNPVLIIPEGLSDANAAATAYIAAANAGEKSDSWSIEDGATANSASIRHDYTTSSGAKTGVPLKFVKSANVSEDFTAGVEAVKAFDGETAAMSYKYAEYAGQKISGVVYKAYVAELSSAFYVKYIMAAGDIIVDGYSASDKIYLKKADWATPQDYLEAVAGAIDA